MFHERTMRVAASVFGAAPTASLVLGDLLVQSFVLEAGTRRRTLSAPNAEQLLCVLVRDGSMAFSLTDDPARRWQIEARRGFFLRGCDDVVISFAPDTSAIVIVAQEQLLAAFGAMAGEGVPLFADRSALIAAAGGFFDGLLSALVAPKGVAEYALTRLAEEMVGGLFLERSSVGAGRVQAPPSLYRRALSLIAAKRVELSLTPASLALELAVSPRHLQRAFRDQGTTPSAEIRRLRVELAVKLLTQPRYGVLAVADVAQLTGFATVDDLRRALRLEGLPSPSRVRAAGVSGEVFVGGEPKS